MKDDRVRDRICFFFVVLIAATICVFALERRAQAADELAIATRLAEMGQVEGYYRLGRVYEQGHEVGKDLFEAARQYQLAAEQGHVEAQFSLGLLLTGAVPDSPRNERKSFDWFSKAAAQGHAIASYFVAMSYESGNGTEQSSELAFEWYRRAATGGNVVAMNALARMYATGAGIKENLPNAHAWNEVAAAQGYSAAARYRDELEARMSEEDIDRARKLGAGLLKKYATSPAQDL